jgi:hypothetical protein
MPDRVDRQACQVRNNERQQRVRQDFVDVLPRFTRGGETGPEQERNQEKHADGRGCRAWIVDDITGCSPRNGPDHITESLSGREEQGFKTIVPAAEHAERETHDQEEAGRYSQEYVKREEGAVGVNQQSDCESAGRTACKGPMKYPDRHIPYHHFLHFDPKSRLVFGASEATQYKTAPDLAIDLAWLQQSGLG